MALTYEPLAKTTFTSNSASATFSNISGSYTDLIAIISGKNSSSMNNGRFRINSDSGSNYSGVYIQRSASFVTGLVSNSTYHYLSEFTTTNFSPQILHIMDYSNTTTFKPTLWYGGDVSDRTAVWNGIWRSTSAVTSLEFSTFGGDFAAGTTISLYGIKSA